MNSIKRFGVAAIIAATLGFSLADRTAAQPRVEQPPLGQPPVEHRAEVRIATLGISAAGADDFAPAALRGGEDILFTSTRSGEQRLWRASRNDDGWSTPVTESAALEHARQIGVATLTPDGTFMIFAATDWDGEDADAAQGRTDLYSAELVRGRWSNIRNLGPNVNSGAWESQPSLAGDGSTLYFASDRSGGLGGTDIYVSVRNDGEWSRAVNLGAAVNTPADELSPSIAPDGKSLFFASNGHGGVGGFDLFVAGGGGDRGTGWGAIRNLGTPINSPADDFYFVSLPNSTNAYFVSDRGGDMDVMVAYPNPFPAEAMVAVAGIVSDAATHTPVAAKITVTDLASGEVAATYTTDDRTGGYYVLLARGHRYSLTATAADYIFYSDEYSVAPNAPGREVRKNIDLNRASGGTVRLLVFFDYDRDELRNESRPELNRAAEFLRSHPQLHAEIAGHTDSVGSPAYNRGLSRNRAEAVRRFLVTQGIDAARLSAGGYGEEQPVDDNGTDDGRARNRRVEMRVGR